MHLNDGSMPYRTTNLPAITTTTWNGGVCSICAARYVGYHRCSREDIVRKIADLSRMLDLIPAQPATDRTAGCPCRPENGGSGVCGCVLGSQTVC